MYCKNCGAELPADAQFCQRCGTRQNGSAFEKVESFVDNVASKADEQTDNVINSVEQTFNPNQNKGGIRVLKTDRSIIVYILLSIITCGIYDFFFVHSLAKDVNEACASDGEKTPGAGIFILMWLIAWAVAFATGLASTASYVAVSNAMRSGNYGMVIVNSSAMLVPYVIVSIIRGIYPLYWRYKLGNKLQRNGNEYGLMINENGSTVLLWDIIGIVCCCIGSWYALYILIKNSNSICTAYNNKYVLNR